MLARLRSRLTYANVVATLALFVAMSTGGAYAANTVFSTDIVDGEVKTQDLATGAVNSGRLAANSVSTAKVLDNNLGAVDLAPASVATSEVLDNSLAAADLAPNSVGTSEVASNSLAAGDLATGSVGTSEVADNSLAGADVLDSTIKSADIAPLTITGFDLAFNSVDGVHVIDDTLTEADIDEARLFQCRAATVLFNHLCASGGAVGNLGVAFNTCGISGLRLPTWVEAYLLARNFDVPGVGAGEHFWTDEVTAWSGNTPVALAVDENGNAISTGGVFNEHKIVCVHTPTGLP